MRAIRFLQFEVPNGAQPAEHNRSQAHTQYIPGLWITDEATDIMIRAARDGLRETQAEQLGADPNEVGYRLVVWPSTTRAMITSIMLDPLYVGVADPHYRFGTMRGDDTERFIPQGGSHMYQLLGSIQARTTEVPQRYYEDFTLITMYTQLAQFFEPAPYYKAYAKQYGFIFTNDPQLL